MADTTKLIIELEVILRNLNRTLRGLDQVKRRLNSIVAIKPQTRGGPAQDLASQQERARQATERLIQSQNRLSQTRQRASNQERQNERILEGARRRREAEDRRQRLSAESLQRQRSAALIRQFREQERIRASAVTLDQALGRIGGSLRNLGLGLTSLGASLSVGVTAPLAALGVVATQNAVTLDSLQRGLVAITGSADEASRQLQRLTEIAKLPGIGFQEAIQGSIRLQAVGFNAQVAERALREFANAVALTGGGREELSRITVQLGQLSAKGKVLAQDLKPIIEAGPAVGRALLQAFGTVNSEDIQALGLSSEQFIDKLLDQLEQLPRAASGIRNTFDNFSDALFRASAAIGEGILPILTRLIEVAEPVITALASGFKSLPGPIQAVVVVFGGLAAAIGPAFFILGQFATGIGGLISAFGRLHALGITPTIEGFRLLTQVMRGNASLAAGQAATVAAASAGWVALGGAVLGVITVLGLLGVAIASGISKQKSAVKIADEQVRATQDQIKVHREQLSFIDSLNQGVTRTADQQARLTQIYNQLNNEAQQRVGGIINERTNLQQLSEEIEKLLSLRLLEQQQQAAALAASFAGTVQQIQARENEIQTISRQIEANSALREAIAATGIITADQSKALARQGINAAEANEAIGALSLTNEGLIQQQRELRDESEKLTKTGKEQAATLAFLEQRGHGAARQFLETAKAAGIFKGSIEDSIAAMEAFIRTQREIESSADKARNALLEQAGAFVALGKAAEKARQTDEDVVKGMLNFFSRVAKSRQEFDKLVDEALARFPELRQAVERLRKDGTFADAFNRLIGRDRKTDTTGFRNAQQQLADAVLSLTEATQQERATKERVANEKLLAANEAAFRLQLTSYRQYLEARANLTDANLKLEIDSTALAAKNARGAQVRLLDAAKKAGVPQAERLRRQAQATAEEEKAIRAETRLVELEAEREQIVTELKEELGEAAIQQLRDTRQLEIEFAELQGRIEDALNTATAEKFNESLKQLSLSQDFLNKQLEKARKAGDKDRQLQIEKAQRLNQRQIDVIENLTRQEQATNQLTAANEFIRRAKERQVQLEREIAFEVEFRGLKEEDAIRKRLDGERRLQDSLRVVRDLVQAEIEALNDTGVKPPQALLDFIRDTKDAIRGLGELPFSEQFRLAEKEFDRLNDQRQVRIAEVERAIRTRNIAESTGLLVIRGINREYAGDLQQQVELLKEIAERSGDIVLQRQAVELEQAAKDANEELASFNRQLASTSIDALQEGFREFFASIGDNTKTMREKLLDLIDSVVARINEVIAENLSQKLIESIFGGGDEAGSGLINAIKRVFGIKPELPQAEGPEHAGEEVLHGLEVGVTSATASFSTGVTTAGAGFSTTVVTAATSFASVILSAASAFAAAITASGATQAAGGLGSLLGGVAATGLYPAVPGGVYKVVEGGYPEAVLTTDPKHAARQLAILKAFLRETRGLGGRIKGFAAGALVMPDITARIPTAPMPSLDVGSLSVASAPSTMRLRQILVDERDVGNWINSPEGERVLVDFLNKNQSTIRKLSGNR